MRLILAVFLGLALAQFKNDRLLARFENSAVKEPGLKIKREIFPSQEKFLKNVGTKMDSRASTCSHL